MRAMVAEYSLVEPKDLTEALMLVAAGHRPFAGGTDLMVVFETGKLASKQFVSLWKLSELQGIRVDDTHVTIGALTTYSRLRDNPIIKNEFPNLFAAAGLTGARAIQNRGTIGGNIANASPAADSPPALLVYDAEVCLRSLAGERWVSYDQFHIEYKRTMLAPGEIISAVRLPRSGDGARHYYRKVGTRRAQAISKVCMAVCFRRQGEMLSEVRIALGSVGPVPMRARHAEAVLEGQTLSPALLASAQAMLAKEISPIDDIRSTRDYRLTVARNILPEAFA